MPIDIILSIKPGNRMKNMVGLDIAKVKKLVVQNQKNGIVMLGALLITSLAACASNEAPKSVIMEAVINSENVLWQTNFTFDNLKITNSYTKIVDNETVHFYDYTIDAHPKDPSNKNVEAMMGGEQTQSGEIEVVKRGNEWFDLTNS